MDQPEKTKKPQILSLSRRSLERITGGDGGPQARLFTPGRCPVKLPPAPVTPSER